MSHYYELRCLDCKGTITPEVNRDWEALADAVQDTALLVQLRLTGRWENPEHERVTANLADYLTTHAACSGFVVEGEYTTDEPLIFKRQPDGTYERDEE